MGGLLSKLHRSETIIINQPPPPTSTWYHLHIPPPQVFYIPPSGIYIYKYRDLYKMILEGGPNGVRKQGSRKRKKNRLL